eukprot:scaffold164133_cov35-Tisochrysis_lutea.AAC.2
MPRGEDICVPPACMCDRRWLGSRSAPCPRALAKREPGCKVLTHPVSPASTKPPPLLQIIYEWIDDDDFELITLHELLNQPIEDELAHPSSRRSQPSSKRVNSSKIKPSTPRYNSGISSKRMSAEFSSHGNIQVYWACFSHIMDELLEVRDAISTRCVDGAVSNPVPGPRCRIITWKLIPGLRCGVATRRCT